MDPNQCSKQNDQPTPPLAKTKARTDNDPQKYVVLPYHPLYGCLVSIIKRQVATTYVKCTIEDPVYPGFRYQIREHWLSSSQPPPLPISPMQEEAICLPLSDLDTMVQRLLATPYFRRITDDEHTCHTHDASPTLTGSVSGDLASASSKQPDTTEQSPLLPGAQPSRRDDS
jgi:hypothetical protein